MSEYKLTYFNVRGLAEPIRLLFALAQVPYEDNRIAFTMGETNEIPPEIKSKLAYGQVPLLEFDGHSLVQSATIARFLAKRFNLLGKNELEAAQIDEIVDANKDYMDSYKPFWYAKDEDAKAATLKNILEVTTPKYVAKFNQILENNGSGFMVGDSVSWADIVIFYMLASVEIMLPIDLKKEYSALGPFQKKIGEIPQIKDWIEVRPKTPF